MAGDLWRNRGGLNFPRAVGSAGLMAVLLLAGCSTGTVDSSPEIDSGVSYEDRLKATADEFAYYGLLDANLAGEVWEQEGISLRVPKPFRPLDSLKTRKFLGLPLPGQLGAWKADLPGDGGGARPAYLFLMSNHHLWAHSRARAMGFHQWLIEEELAELPGLNVLPVEAGWSPQNPSGHGLPHTVGRFEASLPAAKGPAEFTMFLFQHGVNRRRDEIKVALLFVIPKSAEFAGSSPEVDPKTLSAETLRIVPREVSQP